MRLFVLFVLLWGIFAAIIADIFTKDHQRGVWDPNHFSLHFTLFGEQIHMSAMDLLSTVFFSALIAAILTAVIGLILLLFFRRGRTEQSGHIVGTSPRHGEPHRNY